ncbi:MAG: uroporphyrinogen decarboxylase family protein [Clostridium sp.]
MFKEVTQKTGLQFPEAYKHWDSMALLSKQIKKHNKSSFCKLPFCHTVEGEALGGSINLGDENIGPRVKEYICKNSEEILDLPGIDYSKGRISEVLKACKYLRENNENVVLYISGPFTIMDALIDPIHIYKSFRKNPKLIKDIFDKFQNELLRFIKEAQRVGIDMISYADSSAGVGILGPKLSREVVEKFTYPLLKRVESIINDETIFILCPKTSFALIGTGTAVWKDIHLKAPTKYSEACIEVIGKTKFVGQTCINNKEFELKSGIIKTLNLL